MSLHNDTGDMLHFTRNDDGTINLEDLSKALGAYDTLVKALTGKSPSYEDFTDFLQREGYATAYSTDETTTRWSRKPKPNPVDEVDDDKPISLDDIPF
jgi:hypothetical protein